MLTKRSLLFFTIACMSLLAKAQDAQDILISMDNLMSAPKDRVATVEMTLINKKGTEKVREASLKQKGVGYRLYRYTKPEKQAGVATLSLPDGKMWLYMPSFGKAIKITLLSKSQAFTGTDFSYEDMSGIPYSERYEAKFETSNNEEEYLLTLTPKIKKTEYSKVLVSIHKKNGYPVQMAFFDKMGNYIKNATYSYIKQGKYWYANEVTMTNLQKEHTTKITIKEIDFDTGLTEDDFSIELLKNQEATD